MEFRIIFSNGNYHGHCVVNYNEELGLDFVDEVRQKEEIENLKIELFPETAEGSFDDIFITIDEKKARKLGFFTHNNILRILIGKNGEIGQLNKYAYTDYTIHSKDESTGEILSIFSEVKIDKSQLLADWEAAGCPLEWDVK